MSRSDRQEPDFDTANPGFFDLVGNMRDQGISIIVISHNLEHVFQIADRIAVLKNGRLIDVVTVADTTRDTVVKMITFGSTH